MAALLLGAALSLSGQQQIPRFGDLGICSLCHLRIPAPERAADLPERWMGPAALWPSSMMAHSARDPYWRAKVHFETASTPSLAPVIEDTCLRCHAPMQQYEVRAERRPMALKELNRTGEQGVGCTVCHQVTEEGLGSKESFEAGFVINGERLAFGPHPNPFSHPMEMHSGYIAAEGRHVAESALCGTCHTVITPSVNAAGKITGEFVEQAPFLEWLASDLATAGVTCQQCHMPPLADAGGARIAEYIAHNPAGFPFPPTMPREPFGLHHLVGGNVPMLRMLRELNPGEADGLDAKIRRTQKNLEDAIGLDMSGRIEEGALLVTVSVSNETGHKLPTGFPSRRVWLHLTVSDAAGKTMFESGAWDAKGEIAGLGGLEPHRARITSPSQVVIYEAEMADSEGAVTTSLLRAASYAKDNRLLPLGFASEGRLPDGVKPESIAPAGVRDDPAFQPGGHTVIYEAPVNGGKAPFRITCEALYQSVKPSHARAIEQMGAEQADRFAALFSRHSAPVVMATTAVAVQ